MAVLCYNVSNFTYPGQPVRWFRCTLPLTSVCNSLVPAGV